MALSPRQQTLELLTRESKNSKRSPVIRRQIKDVIHDLVIRKIDEDQAMKRFIELTDPNIRGYWYDLFKPKALFLTLTKYYRGELTTIQVAKMISTLMTHLLIESEKHPDLDKDLLKLNETADLLSDFSRTHSVDTEKVDSLLESLGLNISKEVNK